MSVLIVEDEREIAELIRFHLEREGFAASTVHSGKLALDAIKRDSGNPPDLIILDLMLPDLGGLEVCRRLKWQAETRNIPILIVSAKGEEADIVAGIELGAEDYVTKPFSPRVLMARVKNVLRRHDAESQQAEAGGEGAGDGLGGRLSLADGALVIDPARHRVWVNGAEVELTLTEFALLHYLAARPGFVRTRDQIIAAVHGKQTVLSSRTVDVHITALRRKLGGLAAVIETVRGVGYRLAEVAPATTDDGT